MTKIGSWRRKTLVGGALLAFVATGAGGVAFGAIAADGHGGMRLAHLQRRIRTALDSVGATTVQEDKIHDIVATGLASMADRAQDRRAMRMRMLELLKASTIDRAAVEKLRQEQLASFDARLKAITGIMLDSADQLTPDQRVRLGDRAIAMMTMRAGRDGGPDGERTGRGWRHHGGQQPGSDDSQPPARGNPG